MNTTFLIALFLFALHNTTYSQVPNTVKGDTIKIFGRNPEVSPSYPGGWTKFYNYVNSNLRWEQGQITVEGIVYIEFFVETDGTISDAKVIRGLFESCDKEAVRLIMTMPKWIPGTLYGKPKRTKMIVPIVFKM